MEESALTDVSSDQLLLGSSMLINNSGLIAVHKPYISDDISCKNTFGVKRCGQISHLEVNA